jgi:hypothetical protein
VDQVDRLYAEAEFGAWDRCVKYFQAQSDLVLELELNQQVAGLKASCAQVAMQIADQLRMLATAGTAAQRDWQLAIQTLALSNDRLRFERLCSDLQTEFQRRCALLGAYLLQEADAILSRYHAPDVTGSLRNRLDEKTAVVLAQFKNQLETESQLVRDQIGAEPERIALAPSTNVSSAIDWRRRYLGAYSLLS